MTDDLADLEASLSTTLDLLSDIRTKLAPLQADLDRVCNLRDKIVDRITVVKLAEMAEGSLDWPYLLEANGGMKRLYAAHVALESLGLMSSGYMPDTNQRGISVCLIKGDSNSLSNTMNGFLTANHIIFKHCEL